MVRQHPICKNIKLCVLISNTKSIYLLDGEFTRMYLKEKMALLGVLRGANPTLWQQTYIQMSEGLLELDELAAVDLQEPLQQASA